MKRMILTLGGLLFCSNAIAAPVLSIDTSSIDFGTIVQGKKYSQVVTLRNTGDSNLEIGKVVSSCGCTATNLSSKVIPPGKKGELSLVFDSTNFSGAVTKTVTVETNDPKVPSATVTLKGRVSEVVGIEPRQLSLGKLKPGSRKTAVLIVENHGKQAVSIVKVRSAMPQLTALPSKMKLEAGEKAEIVVTVEPRPVDRILSGYLVVELANAPKKELTVPVFGSVSK